MQAYDLIMLIVLGMATIFGAIKGFAWQVASLASIIVSYIVAYRYRFDVAEMIQAKPPWNQFLAMLVLYMGSSFVIWVGFRLLSGAIDKVRLKEFDRHLGAAFGLAKGCIYCLLITMFAMSLLGPNQQAAICQSKSGFYIATALDRGVGILPKEIHDVVGPYLANLDSKLKNGQQNMPDQNATAGGSDVGGMQLGWPGSIPNLPALPEGFQNEIADALPGLPLPNMGAGTGAGGANWLNSLGQPQQPSTSQPANGFGVPNSGYPSTGYPGFPSSGIQQPVTPPQQQAQQPGLVLPR